MPRKCYVKGCDTGTVKETARLALEGSALPASLFKPKKEQIRNWEKIIGRPDRKLTTSERVCSRHFDEKYIIRFYETKLKNGTVYRQKRPSPVLKDEAIPNPVCESIEVETQVSEEYSLVQTPPESDVQISMDSESTTELTFAESEDIPFSYECVANEDVSLQESSQVSTEQSYSQVTSILLLSESPATDRSTIDSAVSHSGNVVHSEHSYSRSERERPCTLAEIHARIHDIELPGHMWGVHTIPKKKSGFSHIDENDATDITVMLTDSMDPRVYIRGKLVTLPEAKTIQSVRDLEDFLKIVSTYKACPGTGITREKYSVACAGFLVHTGARPPKRCIHCQTARRRLHRQKPIIPSDIKVQESKQRVKNLTMANLRKQRKIQSLTQKMKFMREQCANYPKDQLNEALKRVPEEQRDCAKAIFDASSRKSSKGRRYTRQWVYDCLLMRMRGPKLYRSLRCNNKLPLPSNRTLERYLKNLRPEYGFQFNTFEVMGEKRSDLPEEQTRGTLLLDEMQTDEALTFVKDSMKVHGLVNLGKHTRKQDRSSRGNHALVMMFQPFRGAWVQAIGAFLGRGAVPGSILKHLVIEGIVLLENAGFKVDCVTTDGASWNRTMWDMMGINKDQSDVPHPVDPSRKLFYASDFPHLIKNLWSRIAAKKTLTTPDGVVRLEHWEAVIEENRKLGIKVNYTLNDHHINPTTYQKMNVRMAMQFFGHRVASAMKYYKEKGLPAFQDADPTIAFIEKMNKVIDAMNSRTPHDALYADPSSRNNQVLQDFLAYLELMNDEAANKRRHVHKRRSKQKIFQDVFVGKGNVPEELTSSTYLGLVVTTRAALDLIAYLHKEAGYSYIMTRRINQDNLEHFFGHIRQNCGANTHPDPLLFIQVYRLLSTYSLVKPIRGSNVSGLDLFSSLIALEDLTGQENKIRRENLEKKIEEILDNATDFPEEFDHNVFTEISINIDDNAMTVFAGYSARKLVRTAAKNCLDCQKSLCKEIKKVTEGRETYLSILSHGGLIWPSKKLFQVLIQIEKAIVETVASEQLTENFLFTILDRLMLSTSTALVGCDEHDHTMTTATITFYLICRMHFVCAEANKQAAEKKRQKKWLAKQAKLQ